MSQSRKGAEPFLQELIPPSDAWIDSSFPLCSDPANEPRGLHGVLHHRDLPTIQHINGANIILFLSSLRWTCWILQCSTFGVRIPLLQGHKN